MKKLGLLLAVTGAMAIAACSAVATNLSPLPERDARVIVEVNRKLDNLSEDAIRQSQDLVYNNIKQYATDNVRLVKHYDVLNNAFLMEVNSEDIENIKSVPGVASVTVDKMHWERTYNEDEYELLGDPDDSQSATQYDENDNISAITMNKPDDTNDGEGTLIAILDNEFHFRAKVNESTPAWYHEVFSPLDDGVAVKYTYNTIKGYTLNATARKFGSKAGEEGSEYLNNKVPFYFDYGGLSYDYGKAGAPRYDVHSDLSYHGSHVASIAAANAPLYKGIAPKAQLACMKVFTDYNAKGMGEKLGFTNHTGAYDSVILSALEDCITLKVDGINMSLGSDLDDFDSDSITMKTLARLADAGILSAISAGNSGKASFSKTGAYANWNTSMVETGILGSYANSTKSTIVASGHPVSLFYENAFSIAGKNVAFEDQIVNREGTDDDYEVEYRMKDIFNGDEALEWVYVPGFGSTADYAGLTVRNKIVVVNRGSTSFADKYTIAANKNAAALVIINNDPSASDFNFRCSFGEGFSPSMPCCLVLYKDKGLFEQQRSGELRLISKQMSENPNAYTVSSFSTDGASFNLDLKPEITTPGDNIKGAVPEHAMSQLTRAERESPEYKYKCYQYLSGTSMAAPNYAGAQSLVLSEKAAEVYASGPYNPLNAEDADLVAYRKTVDMRLMSTAKPMTDNVENPETNELSPISPRIQGAGMVDLEDALNTKVYLEGYEELDAQGQPVGSRKSKVTLRNNADIAKGDVKISFIAHNESETAKNYRVKLTVMRPAIAHPNDFVTRDYNFRGEIDDVSKFSGVSFYDEDLKAMSVGSGAYAYKDVFKVSRDIEYYASEADYEADRKTTIKEGYYYNAANEGADWKDLPSYTAQSTKDVVLAEVTGQTVSVPAGDSVVNINSFSLTEEQKNAILETYEYGCMIEGFVSLESTDNEPDLSIPFLGFYSGTDKNAEASYDSAPVAEPFNFEKDYTKVYPSDLVNDITKSLIGKDKVNFESMIVAGYAESTQRIQTGKVLSNDQSFDNLTGFYKVGTNPLNDEFTDNPGNDIYVGGPKTSNMMIIQQFMLRSVRDNYFTITEKGENGKTIYSSALEDMLFGDSMGKWSLYKSHVDTGYLSAGYVAHRAYAIVPLFNQSTGEPFKSGEYELTFNYQLAANNHWVKKTYALHIDSDAPKVKSIDTVTDADGNEKVRIYFEEQKLAYGVIGYNLVDAYYDQERGLYYLEATKEFINNAIKDVSSNGKQKLYFSAVDYARSSTDCLVHANNFDNYSEGLTVVQGSGIKPNYDFTYENGVLKFFDEYGLEVNLSGKFIVDGYYVDTAKKGCGGSITTVGALMLIPTLMCVPLVFLRKRNKQKGGN